MVQELFVKIPIDLTPISDADAGAMKKAVLCAPDAGVVMMMLNEGVVSKYKAAGRFTELLNILAELHNRPFMQADAAAMDLYLKQGQICESMLDFGMAIGYYSLGIEIYATMVKPYEMIGYWLFNNSSFCHDYEKLFPAAQRLARKAVSIDRSRHNAWKNLGVSFEYQGDYIKAAACYLASYIKCDGGSDPRPMMHLTRMFKRHDGLKDKFARVALKEMYAIFSGPYKYFCLAEAYYHCGHLDKAVRMYQQFHAVAPSGYDSQLQYALKVISELKELKKLESQLQKG
jgi:tetratricopeptide (TPR) repeat protein